jgi:molybdate transport system substrate-binding protein
MERFQMYRVAGLLTAFVVLWGSAISPAPAQEKTLTVFAAASMKNALDDIDAAFTTKTGIKVNASYAASSQLAKQIEQGAPADIFVSADTDWMDYATARKIINEPTRVNLLGNSIVLIAPKDSKIDNVTIGQGFDLSKLAGDGKIATGDVKAVPVGKYAKAALEKFGAWSAAAPKFAMAESVRAALTLVARGEAALGIVYSTDARVEPGVKIVGTFPADSHPAIIYPVAATSTAKPEAKAYLDYLQSSAAKAVLEKYGFNYLIKPTS